MAGSQTWKRDELSSPHISANISDKISVIHFKFSCSAELFKTYTIKEILENCLDLPLQEASTYNTTSVKLGTKIFALNCESITES